MSHIPTPKDAPPPQPVRDPDALREHQTHAEEQRQKFLYFCSDLGIDLPTVERKARIGFLLID